MPTTPSCRCSSPVWEALTLILRDGRACIDNSPAERGMRPIAIGRRKWSVVGSNAGGQRAAAIYNLIETAKLHGLDPETYMRDISETIEDDRRWTKLWAKIRDTVGWPTLAGDFGTTLPKFKLT